MLMPISCLNVELGKCLKPGKCLSMEIFSLYWLQMKILADLNEEPLSRKPSKHDSLLFLDARSKGPRVFECSVSILWAFCEHSLSVLWAFSKSSLSIQRVFSERSLSVLWMFSESSLSIQRVFSECSLRVLWVISNLPLSDLWVIAEWCLKVPSVCSELPWVVIWSEYCDTGVGLSDN